ncbi:MAG: hypothetical protein ABJC05_05370 [Pyrinomonadaceae bacterium]
MFAVVRLPLPVKFAALFLLASASLMLVTSGSQAQRARASAQAGGDDPAFNEFKGVRLGMTVDETRKKLGDPKDKSDEQDFYLFGDKLAAQVLYKLHKVVTISIDFMGGEAPSPKQVLGADVEAKPDGSMNKVVRYPKAGYWVCYNRTAGDSPVISITMQKIEQ